MTSCFGVHLGNGSICLALSRDGKTEVIANDSGDRVTPATAVFNGPDIEICIPLKSGSRRKTVITSNKRLFNSEISPEEISALNAKNDCKIVSYQNTYNYELQIENNVMTLTPDQIATKFYGKMFSIATHAACTDEELQSVIATPLHWSDECQQRVVTAAELAGFNVLQVISEPAAAMLAYNFDESNAEEIVLIYRLGGSSCDVSVVRVVAGVFTIEESSHQTLIGGQYITKDLADYIAKEFYQRWKLDPNENKRAMDKLFHYANDCKHVLSTLNSAHVFIESLYEGIDWSQNISRARFDNVVLSKVEACVAPVRKFLAESQFKSKINKIILCGGSMKIPRLQTMVSDLLPDAVVLSNVSPDEVIAQGCARQAALLLEYPDIPLNDRTAEIECITLPIYAKYLESNLCLFPVGSPIYSEVELPLSCAEKLKKINLSVYEAGETDKVLGDYTFTTGKTEPKIHAILHDNDLIVNVF
ncbi:heat shock 70 kDa protein 14-like [Arctopsyche grandis]|uniref:heat shock 70 kDa protein 14-like n=1 Tax=Arctopsyche grandis TaxID=121162 RepID=UPI00406D91F8